MCSTMFTTMICGRNGHGRPKAFAGQSVIRKITFCKRRGHGGPRALRSHGSRHSLCTHGCWHTRGADACWHTRCKDIRQHTFMRRGSVRSRKRMRKFCAFNTVVMTMLGRHRFVRMFVRALACKRPPAHFAYRCSPARVHEERWQIQPGWKMRHFHPVLMSMVGWLFGRARPNYFMRNRRASRSGHGMPGDVMSRSGINNITLGSRRGHGGPGAFMSQRGIMTLCKRRGNGGPQAFVSHMVVKQHHDGRYRRHHVHAPAL